MTSGRNSGGLLGGFTADSASVGSRRAEGEGKLDRCSWEDSRSDKVGRFVFPKCCENSVIPAG